jgi:putative FmdB family regulatory protein
MQKWKAIGALVFAIGAVSILIYQLVPGRGDRPPVYEWSCSKCGHQFRQAVRLAAEDLPVIDCPKCKTASAERLMHYQCRNCWTKYDLRGSKATLANIVCPSCRSRAARNIDHPIPGDDEPIEGGKPNPDK